MAYDFNGTNQFLSIAAAPVLNPPLTLACWFNSTNTTNIQALVCINATSTVDRHVLYARGDVAGDPVRMQSANQGGANGNADTTSGYSSGAWAHACGVVSSNNNRTAYINGGSSGTNTTSAALSTSPVQCSIAAQRFSLFLNGASFASADIAEVGIWNAALTAAEIASLADGMTCDKVRPQSLVFYAPLVRDLIDYKGGLTITNNNTATVANHPRVYV
jgi:hypothetical protein